MHNKIHSTCFIMAMITVLLTGFSLPAEAESVKFGIVCEMTGGGAPVGKQWERAILMSTDEINQAGGILGKKIETFTLDTKSEPPVSVAAVKKAIGEKPFVVFGTVYSSSTIVNMSFLEKAGIPQFTGSEMPGITDRGNNNIFRTSYHAGLSMQKVVKWLTEVIKAKDLAVLVVNNAVGKGARDSIVEQLTPKGVKIVADVVTDPGQTDYSGELAKIKMSGADTLFIFLHEEESARVMIQIREMGLDKMMKVVGHTTLLASDTIRIAGDALNGIEGHVDITPVAPTLQPVTDKYFKMYNEMPDHNFFKGYIGVYVVKAAVEAIGEFNQQKLRDYLHGRTLYVKDHPGILMDIHIDEKGDIDRDSFLIVIKDQKPVIKDTLGPLHPENF